MTAGQDEARAQRLFSAIRDVLGESDDEFVLDRDECVSMLNRALSEARDQGAREMRSEFDATALALGEEIKALRDDATAPPALATLREAVVQAAMLYANETGSGDVIAARGDDLRDACAALSSAQGSTTEGRKP